jgi:pimeloyl-ACP methyl ester carboxylesterase
LIHFYSPGHGLSDHFPPDIAYNYIDTLLAVERLMKRFQWQKVSFLVHSLGGATAMLYAGVVIISIFIEI